MFAGCGGETDKTTTTLTPEYEPEPEAPESPTPYEYEESSTPPQFDQTAIEDAMQAAVDSVRIATGQAPLAAYDAMFALADASCPIFYEAEGTVYWYGGCTAAESGAVFSGYAFYEWYVDSPHLGDDSSLTGPSLNGQGMITAADGTRLDIGGSAYHLVGTTENGGVEAWMTGAVGAFEWTADEVDETWMGGTLKSDNQSFALQWTLPTATAPEVFEKHQGVMANAGFTGLGTTWDAVYLSDVLVVDDLGGYWPCPEETGGIISVRSPDAYWYQVIFDMEQDADGNWSIPEGLCDGCGTVFTGGEVVGEACVDFSSFTDWEDQPW